MALTHSLLLYASSHMPAGKTGQETAPCRCSPSAPMAFATERAAHEASAHVKQLLSEWLARVAPRLSNGT